MNIQQAQLIDVDSIERLMAEVSKEDVLPLFNEQGKREYTRHVLTEMVSLFENSCFHILKMVSCHELIAFGVLRDGNYLTHLFVAKSHQGIGAGGALLDALLGSTTATEITLRSSVNALNFYQAYGFRITGNESEFNGIRFIPMCLNVK